MIRNIQILLLLCGLLIPGITNCKRLSCDEPCRQMIECTVKMSGKKVTETEMDLLTKGCSNSCKKHSQLMWKCYEESKGSGDMCKSMLECGKMNFEQ